MISVKVSRSPSPVVFAAAMLRDLGFEFIGLNGINTAARVSDSVRGERRNNPPFCSRYSLPRLVRMDKGVIKKIARAEEAGRGLVDIGPPSRAAMFPYMELGN